MKDFLISILFMILFILFLYVIFSPTQKEKDAYKKCIQTYDAKTCEKLIYGKYK